MEKTDYNERMAPIYNNREAFEAALEKTWNYYNNSGSRIVDSCEDNYIECVFAKGFREGFLYGKQKEQNSNSFENIEKEYVFRPLAGTDITIAAEQAIRRANEGDRLVLAFNGAYIPVRKGCNANKIVDIYDAFIKNQKEQKESLRDFIDDFPYSAEQKEQELIEPEFKTPDWVYHWDSEYMINTVIGRYSLHAEVAKKRDDTHEYNLSKSMENWLRNVVKPLILEKQKEQTEELSIRLNGLIQEYVKAGEDEEEQEHRLKCYQLFWDALGDSEFFKKKEQKPSIFPPKLGEVHWNPISSVQQKPAEWSKNDTAFLNEITDFFENKTVRLQHDLDMYAHWLKSLPERFNLQSKQEWDEFDEDCLKRAIWYVENPAPSVIKDSRLALWLNMLRSRFFLKSQTKAEWSEENNEMRLEAIRVLESGCERYRKESGHIPSWYKVINWLKSLNPQPKVEWSKEDEKKLNHILEIVHIASGREASVDEKEELESFLKSLRPQPKQQWKRYIWTYNMKFTEDALVIYEDNSECEFVKKGNKPRRNVSGTYVLIKDVYPQPHWKPSDEDEERLINTSISFLKDFADKGYENAIECIDWLKSKLNGDSGK